MKRFTSIFLCVVLAIAIFLVPSFASFGAGIDADSGDFAIGSYLDMSDYTLGPNPPRDLFYEMEPVYQITLNESLYGGANYALSFCVAETHPYAKIGCAFIRVEEDTNAVDPRYRSFVFSDTFNSDIYTCIRSPQVNQTNGYLDKYGISSAVAGNEGLFNLGIQGNGILCLESVCPKEELVEITLENDVLKVDGNMAIAWSGSLDFTVERSGKSLIGSAASGEGLVNVYRGTGKVLLAPVTKGIA